MTSDGLARSEELRALAQRVADALPPEAIEVVLTGSVSRGVADDVSDIEMLVVTEEQLSLDEAFELARLAGLEEVETWGDPATPTRRVHGYLDGQSVETIWWSRQLAEELYATGSSAEAIANGVPLRTSGLLADWQARLADYPDELVAERVEKAAERWGGWTPEGLLTIVRPDCSLARMEWMVDAAQRVLAIVFALNRVHQPTAKRLAERVEPTGDQARPPSGADRGGARRSGSAQRPADDDRAPARHGQPARRSARTSTAPASWLAEGLATLGRG